LNEKDDNGVEPGALHRSPSIHFTPEKNTGKPQDGDRLKTVQLIISLNGVPFRQMESIEENEMKKIGSRRQKWKR
jgi:hypothetical protein